MCYQNFLSLERTGTKLNIKNIQTTKNPSSVHSLSLPLPEGKKSLLTVTEDSKLKIYLIPFSHGSSTGEMNFKI